MIEVFNHKLGEKFTLVVDLPANTELRIFRAVDGKLYNNRLKRFEAFDELNNLDYVYLTQTFAAGGSVSSLMVDFIPRIPNDLVFEYKSNGTVLKYERHLFGGYYDTTTAKLCTVYGTLVDPSGNPMPNVRIEANLTKGGYFIDKRPILGPTSQALSDDAGYFELPLLQGISVNITIPAIGFSTSGYVPKVSALELTPYCLLKDTKTANSQ